MSADTHERKTPTAAQREARKAFKQPDGKRPLSEYERSQRAFHANRERLRSERLAREAVTPDASGSETTPRTTADTDDAPKR